MKAIYIDHELIVAYFSKKHPEHRLAVAIIIAMLQESNRYMCSFHGIFQATSSLIELTAANNEKKITETIIIDRVQSFINKLNVTLITSTNSHIFSQASALMTEYKIPFDIGFYTSIMMEHKIKTIATVDKRYDKLLSEGFLVGYGRDKID